MLIVARGALFLTAIAAGMYLTCCVVLFAMQRSMIYQPQRSFSQPSGTTMTLDVHEAHVLVSTRESPGSNAVLYFGGNAEDVSQSLPTLERAFPDSALFALHYRGYNGSTGQPSEQAIIADALALFDRIHATHDRVVAIGRSLGSGVAIHVASIRPVTRLVLVTPYDSFQELAARHFRLFPVRWLLLDKYESWRYAPRVSAPTLLLAAEFDDIIPRSSTESLYQHLPKGLATLIVVPDAGHNTISDTTEYVSLLSKPQ
jgi:pimeloyl-ACP methyl ester carboxylesterase